MCYILLEGFILELATHGIHLEMSKAKKFPSSVDVGCSAGCDFRGSRESSDNSLLLDKDSNDFGSCALRKTKGGQVFLEVPNSCSYCGCNQYVDLESLVSYIMGFIETDTPPHAVVELIGRDAV